ncbi:MAG: hypothetical protein UY81_C0079G0003 [Candidatus Giovannonibacteria bacterium GW2011_GWA2_53_7]|uniref:Uncharacterized protein n=1 Tax=Candidatus Giovannonibacteria bacterium GW2011_GWA2_53_7 TaxID=1618650 RepID=A0A0G2AN67_9BACT|nr:MAG: hypothetical protein UY81_C0079G0003 [Candidatus Giovannonibacteria bacterium GW2011_GWA2_53_7]
MTANNGEATETAAGGREALGAEAAEAAAFVEETKPLGVTIGDALQAKNGGGVEVIEAARKTAPVQAAIQVGGEKKPTVPVRPQTARAGRPVAKNSGAVEEDRQLNLPEEMTWVQKIFCLVALYGLKKAADEVVRMLKYGSKSGKEWSKANTLQLKWGEALNVPPAMLFVSTDGIVSLESLPVAIERFYKLIVASAEPRRIEALLADAKACNRLRQDQAQAKAEAEANAQAKANADELAEIKRQLAEARAAAAQATANAKAEKAKAAAAQELLESATAPAATPEPTADAVGETASGEITIPNMPTVQ